MDNKSHDSFNMFQPFVSICYVGSLQENHWETDLVPWCHGGSDRHPEAVTVIVVIFKKEKPLPPEDEPEGIRDAYVQILGLEIFHMILEKAMEKTWFVAMI